jgi:hypothetical protein
MKRGRRAAIMACCGAMLMAAGCSRPPLTNEQSRALAAAEARWKTSAVRDYSFELRPFYALAFDQCAARIEVRGGVVKQVTRLGSLEPTVMTIDDLFRRIHDAAASGKYETIQANYDSDLGYPTRIVFRTIPEIMDGNSVIEVQAFRRLDRP